MNLASISMLIKSIELSSYSKLSCFFFFSQQWDTSLKVIAEGYAAKCMWNHNPDLEDTGENLFAGTKALDLRQALEEWFLGESVNTTHVFEGMKPNTEHRCKQTTERG